MPSTEAPKGRCRFGIGEWYGRLLDKMSKDDRSYYAGIQILRKNERPELPCPFQNTPSHVVPCSKAGGVCSMRQYIQLADTDKVEIVTGDNGRLRTVCSYRFREDSLISRWVGRTLVGSAEPLVVNEVDFLMGITSEGEEGGNVGRIDQVLLSGDLFRLSSVLWGYRQCTSLARVFSEISVR